jgi:hypothetical protein
MSNLAFGGMILFFVVLFLFILVTQFIYNLVMPDVFGLNSITFWQTLGLLVLAHLFFGGHCNVGTISSNYYSS